MKNLKKFENYDQEEDAEYILKIHTQWVGADIESPLYGFTDDDYEDFKKHGPDMKNI